MSNKACREDLEGKKKNTNRDSLRRGFLANTETI